MHRNRTTFMRPRRNGGWVRSFLLCLIFLGAGGGALYYIFSTEPTAERETATKDTAMPVRTVTPESGTFRPAIEAMGTVKAARDIILRPRVQGEVLERSDNFTPGGYVSKGETLVQLDPADYKNTLRQRKNELQQARADLQLEQGRQDVAEREYEMLDDQLGEDTNKDLVLRKPQLTKSRSEVESARTAVEQAKLDVERTTVKAPFDAHVITRDVNVGSQVAAGDRLARLVGVDRYWVEVRIPLSKLRWISIPDGSSDAPLPDVRIRDRNAWPEGTFRSGQLYKKIGVVGEETRMARVLVEVPDPLGRKDASGTRPELLIDAPVQVEIEGRPLAGVVKLNRDYVRKDDTVWVMSDGKLDIRDVEVVTRDSDFAYVRDGLSGTDQVVTTKLTAVSAGAPLQKRDGPASGASSDSDPEQK